jgi:hypothetical protein
VSRRRLDRYPVIGLTDTSAAQPFISAIKEETRLDATAYDLKRGMSAGLFPYHQVSHQRLETLLKADPEIAKRIDFGLLRLLTSKLQLSQVRRAPDQDRHRRRRLKSHDLVTPGCRARFKTQDALAAEHGCSRQHVNEQIAWMTDLFIVVNHGQGWADLNPNVYWAGPMDHRIAFCEQHCRLTFANDGSPRLSCIHVLQDSAVCIPIPLDEQSEWMGDDAQLPELIPSNGRAAHDGERSPP